MSEKDRRIASAGPPSQTPLPSPSQSAGRPLPEHPVRVALLDLLAEAGSLTSTEAAARLGYSSGLCSFHLRQLARYGLIEEAPHGGGRHGRARPWRLRWESADEGPGEPGSPAEGGPEDFAGLARGLEDESYRHWLAHREQVPAEWQREESFSAVLHLTPAEMAELADGIRRLTAEYAARGEHERPSGAAAVAAVTRLFPLLPDRPDRPDT